MRVKHVLVTEDGVLGGVEVSDVDEMTEVLFSEIAAYFKAGVHGAEKKAVEEIATRPAMNPSLLGTVAPVPGSTPSGKVPFLKMKTPVCDKYDHLKKKCRIGACEQSQNFFSHCPMQKDEFKAKEGEQDG